MTRFVTSHSLLWRWTMLAVFAILAGVGIILSIVQGVASISVADIGRILLYPEAQTAD